jgi:hypothetical protein
LLLHRLHYLKWWSLLNSRGASVAGFLFDEVGHMPQRQVDQLFASACRLGRRQIISIAVNYSLIFSWLHGSKLVINRTKTLCDHLSSTGDEGCHTKTVSTIPGYSIATRLDGCECLLWHDLHAE